MELLDHLWVGFSGALAPASFAVLLIGLLVGTVAGALPGISFVNAMAMALPFTYLMAPLQAMAFLGGIYVGGVFGGSISSILINIPGTPASLPACWDGHPMTRRGEPQRALRIALTASATGGLASALLLTFASPPFARFALRFDQPEFFAATVLGLLSVFAISQKKPLLSLISMLIGVTVGSAGVDPLYGMPRFTFGVPLLQSGINWVVVMIGLFAVSEVVDLVCTRRGADTARIRTAGGRAGLRDLLKVKGAIFRGSTIGCLIGMIPGAGATIGAVLSYGVERQVSPRREQFGTGVEEGLAAPEAAKNATTGAAMIPLLTLGIPGSAATAIMLGAMVLHGINPGPLLFTGDVATVYTIFASMILANIFMILAAVGVARAFATLMKVPPAILGAFIVVLSVLGAYGVRNNIVDVYTCLGFGLLGFVFKRIDFPTPPLILGIILGPLAERYFLTSLINYGNDWTIFFTRPISGTILAVALLFLAWSLWPLLRPAFGRLLPRAAGPEAAPNPGGEQK